MTTLFAATSWPNAAIAIAGIFLVIAIVWQIMATGRTAIARDGDGASKRTNELLTTISDDLADVRTRLAEVERLLKDVG
jgi:hypothetical protein